MRRFATVLIIILLGLLVYGFLKYKTLLSEIRRSEAEIVAKKKEVIYLYERKLKELEVEYSSLIKMGNILPGRDKKKLAELEGRIREMKEVIRQWKEADEEIKQNGLYRMCVEIYGTARSLCESLKEKKTE